MVNAELETASKDLAKTTEKFNNCPSQFLKFDYPTNMAVNFELKTYFQYILEHASEVDLAEGSDHKNQMVVSFQTRLYADEPWKIQKATIILKFWFKVAAKFKLNIGDFGLLQYSI